MGLDRDNTNLGYLLGRAIGICETIAEANNDSTHRMDKALEAVRNYPMHGLGIAMEPTMRTLERLGMKEPELADRLQEEYFSITDKIPADLPEKRLSDKDKMLIVLGYEHQRAYDRQSA